MANRKDKVGAVHGVEVQFRHATVDEIDHLLGADSGGDEPARRRIVVEAFEALGQPARHACARALGEGGGLAEILHRHDAGHDRDVDARRGADVEETQIERVVEEELGDCAIGARVDFRFSVSMSCSRLGLCGCFSG